MGVSVPQTIKPSPSFRQEVEEKSKEKVSACFLCEKCTNGCPIVFAMDLVPHKLLRMINLGLRDEVLRSDTIWVCASCETCTTRCPSGIDIAHIMDSLRQISQKSGIAASQKNVPIFHDAFVSTIRTHGKMWEPGMILRYKLKSKEFTQDMKLGMDMFKKGKLKIIPSKLLADSKVKEIFKQDKRSE